MESASKQVIIQAEETVTSTTEDIVYLQDFPTKCTNSLINCLNQALLGNTTLFLYTQSKQMVVAHFIVL